MVILRDQNLFYHVRRGGNLPVFKKGNYISGLYKKTGKFNNEASIQGSPYTGGGPDANIFFRRPNKRLQPILRKRIFKDLDPATRVIGSLDLTKKERQVTAQIESIQGLEDMIKNFMKTPRLHDDGSPVIDPLTGDIEFEMRTLNDIIKVSQATIFEALKKNNVVPNQRITNIIFSFNADNVKNLLNKYQAILAQFPNVTQVQKDDLFTAAIINERLENIDNIPPAVDVDLGEELERKDMAIPDSWDEAGLERIYPLQGYRQRQWNSASSIDRIGLKAYILKRQSTTANRLRTVNDVGIPMQMLGLQFSHGHVLDLDSLKFLRNEIGNTAIIDHEHPNA